MNAYISDCGETRTFQLRFQSLFDTGRGFVFPCDATGHVNMDALGDLTRNSYLYARALVGLELATPCVQDCTSLVNPGARLGS